MDIFEDKLKLIPVTAGDSHLSKDENLEQLGLKIFTFFFIYIYIK